MPYVWTFPCYILARDVGIDPESDGPAFDESSRFIAPERESGGERIIAIFTDLDLAERYRDDCSVSVDCVRFSSPSQLISFLELARATYQHVAVDLNRQTRHSRLFSIDELIYELGQADQGRR